MDAKQLAEETGLSLQEAEQLLRESGPPQPSHVPSLESQGGDLEFLHSCFPHIPLPVVKAKLEESGDVQQASDMLLNYDLLKTIKPAYVDKKLIRQAKQTAKRNHKQKSRETREGKDLEMLQKLFPGTDKADIEVLYEVNGQNFDQTVTATTSHNSTAFAPHVQSIINGLEVSRTISTAHAPAKLGITGVPDHNQGVWGEREQLQQSLDATLEKIENYKRTKSMPKEFLSELQGNASALKAELRGLDSIHTQAQMAKPDKTIIDFHNMTVNAALTVCQERLAKWLNDSSQKHLKLITGAGRHSHGGIPLIKNAIGKYLRDNNKHRYFIQEDEGAFFLVKTFK